MWKAHSYPLMNLSLRWQKINVGESIKQAIIPVSSDFHIDPKYQYNFTREDCINWLVKNFPEREVPRSACICCPYRSDVHWKKMKEKSPEVFEQACEFDDRIRREKKISLINIPYLHSSLKPLRDVEFTNNTESHIDEECQGMCGN